LSAPNGATSQTTQLVGAAAASQQNPALLGMWTAGSIERIVKQPSDADPALAAELADASALQMTAIRQASEEFGGTPGIFAEQTANHRCEADPGA